jgi:hypothetical protein
MSASSPTLMQMLAKIEHIFTANNLGDDLASPWGTFWDRLYSVSHTIENAFEAQNFFSKSPPPPPHTASDAAAAAAVAHGAMLPPPLQQMDIKYAVSRSVMPINFAAGIDPVNAIVGTLVSLRQVWFRVLEMLLLFVFSFIFTGRQVCK